MDVNTKYSRNKYVTHDTYKPSKGKDISKPANDPLTGEPYVKKPLESLSELILRLNRGEAIGINKNVEYYPEVDELPHPGMDIHELYEMKQNIDYVINEVNRVREQPDQPRTIAKGASVKGEENESSDSMEPAEGVNE